MLLLIHFTLNLFIYLYLYNNKKHNNNFILSFYHDIYFVTICLLVLFTVKHFELHLIQKMETNNDDNNNDNN